MGITSPGIDSAHDKYGGYIKTASRIPGIKPAMKSLPIDSSAIIP
jgi:hypothetical protein